MCIVAAAIPWIIGGVMAVASIGANISANKAAKEQEKAINAQNKARASEIEDSASAELNERARASRRARASARAAAAESGINLSSNSFLAMLNASGVQQGMDAGLITKNKTNQHASREANYKSALSGIQYKTGLGIAVDAAAAGVSGYFGAGGTSYLGKQPGKG